MSQRRLSRAIYWRRRILVLAALIAIAWISYAVFSGGDSDKPKAEPTPTTPTTKAPVKPAPTNGVVSVKLSDPRGGPACKPEQVRVIPSVRPSQEAGGAVDVTMSVSTSSKKACVLDADQASLLVVISSNKSPVWDSNVCKSALIKNPVSLSPKWSTVVETTWSGRGSGKDCSPKEGFASPGGYEIKAATLGGEVGKARFSLGEKPKPKAKEPDDSKQADKKQADKKGEKPKPSTATPTTQKSDKPKG